jgi:hypothetical protein
MTNDNLRPRRSEIPPDHPEAARDGEQNTERRGLREVVPRHEGQVLRQPKTQSDVGDRREQTDDGGQAYVRIAQALRQRTGGRVCVVGFVGVNRFGLAGRVEVIDDRRVPLPRREPPICGEDHHQRDREEQERQPPVRRAIRSQ